MSFPNRYTPGRTFHTRRFSRDCFMSEIKQPARGPIEIVCEYIMEQKAIFTTTAQLDALMIAKDQLERGAWKVTIIDNNATPEGPDFARGDVMHGV